MLSTPPKSWPEFDYRQAAEKIAAQSEDATYIAERTPNGLLATVNNTGDQKVTVRTLRHIMYHSPTGFEYGYGGSGPADLARSILADACGLAVADLLYQDFKFQFVAAANAKDRLCISLSGIREWVVKKLAEKGV